MHRTVNATKPEICRTNASSCLLHRVGHLGTPHPREAKAAAMLYRWWEVVLFDVNIHSDSFMTVNASTSDPRLLLLEQKQYFCRHVQACQYDQTSTCTRTFSGFPRHIPCWWQNPSFRNWNPETPSQPNSSHTLEACPTFMLSSQGSNNTERAREQMKSTT